MRSILRRAFLPLLAALAATPVTAQTPPPAEEIVQRYVEAIGGRDAVLRPQSSRTRGTLSVPAAGMQGEIEVVTAAPDRTVSIVEIPGLGPMRSGYDGSVGWSVNELSIARLLSGDELAAMQDQANVLFAVRDRSVVASMETLERTVVAGEECWQLRLVLVSGRELVDCYSVETGLLLQQTSEERTPTGTEAFVVRLGDYRPVEGILFPFRIVQELMGMEQVIQVYSVTFDDVEPAEFELPDEIRALVDA